MAFKQKGYPVHKGTAAHGAALKKAAYGGTKTWEEGMKASGGKLNEWAKKAKTLDKNSAEYAEVQNKINDALGSSKTHGGGTQSKTVKPVQGKDDEAPKNEKVIKSSVYVPVERNKKKTVELDDEGKRTGNKSVEVTDDKGKVVKKKDVKVDPVTGDRTKTVTKSDSTRKTNRKSYQAAMDTYRDAVKAWRKGGKEGDKPEKPKRREYMRA
jgi:hypothetical protein